MDSSFFVISNNTNTTSNINNDLEQSSSSSSLNYDPFEGFSFLDHQQGMRLYDYFGCSGGGGVGGGGGRNSPLINQCPLDQLDLQHHKNFLFQTDPNQEDDDDLQGTLTGFVDDLGVDSDAGYTSGVDLFAATNNIVDCSDSTEAYYLRLALEQNSCNINGFTGSNSSSSSSSSSSIISNNNFFNNYSDINNNINYDNNNINNNNNNNFNYDCNNYNSCNGDSNTSQKAKRSVLMNLLIDGSDVGAGYTSHNCRALPQKLMQRHQYQQQ